MCVWVLSLFLGRDLYMLWIQVVNQTNDVQVFNSCVVYLHQCHSKSRSFLCMSHAFGVAPKKSLLRTRGHKSVLSCLLLRFGSLRFHMLKHPSEFMVADGAR
jgi:hypothetical protein